MSNVVIAGYARMPFHFARKGKLTGLRSGRTNIDDGAIALATQCIGGGQGIAAILEAA
jgi:hypothetical protein